ncbi:hypothetical protein AcW1_004980 [Taiwanofungus camphoratus]|nr:hypothetical protein AcW2_006009 [Antrodia cinnamomea]KAI0920867.1 hypothetical protein AcW2_006009 [Antrodia cinnamomea]KAI0941265.1 hypothetical protein AcV7_002881 [Antrodia cinnamomea]KAI0960474.1 hypothetical protein AcW1_004980 [Antrodia cinnamomea]
MSSLSSASSSVTATPANVNSINDPHHGQQPAPAGSRIPVTPAVLRSIFSSSRSTLEERALSRMAFFRYVPRLPAMLCAQL